MSENIIVYRSKRLTWFGKILQSLGIVTIKEGRAKVRLLHPFSWPLFIFGFLFAFLYIYAVYKPLFLFRDALTEWLTDMIRDFASIKKDFKQFFVLY